MSAMFGRFVASCDILHQGRIRSIQIFGFPGRPLAHLFEVISEFGSLSFQHFDERCLLRGMDVEGDGELGDS